MMIVPGYDIGEQLHESRNSRIFRATCVENGQSVVLKILNEMLPSPERQARFQQEYNLMRKLHLDGIPSAYGLLHHHGAYIIVAEDFGGTSLNKLRIAAALPLPEWLKLAIRITDCIGDLHRQHIIHKDINPSNIVWNRASGQIKLIDLGIATELSREIPEVSSLDRLEGTPHYLSPEQTGRMNRALDYRTDFYSLGVSLYELLTGQLPFSSDDILELVHAHIAKTPVPAGTLRRETPAILSSIIEKLMGKTAEERYQSAAGLKADLQTCLRTLDQNLQIATFPLGRSDFSERLQISQKLYGRDTQIAALDSAFSRARNGHAELVLVTGYSGVGKSALVHEVQKPIMHQDGYFIEGKFDQYKRDIPYAAIIQAFQELVRLLLTEGEEIVSHWKNKLLQAMGNNGQLIIDVIPELELIIGPQPPIAELPPIQAQNRFNLEFRKFVSTFACADQPLVIFLDDLQWADLPSLQLMSLLLRPPASLHLLLIGAYRDNEISVSHSLPLILRDMAKNDVALQTLALAPLNLGEISLLLCDTLRTDQDTVAGLAELCLAKTRGNPFFLNQFLTALFDSRMLHTDAETGGWRWDLAGIRMARITDNVADLMVAKLQKLPPPTQHILHTAACLGNTFNLKMLALVCESSESDTADLLWIALREELIIPLDESYKYTGASFIGLVQSRNPAYRFLHDRVQHAAYMLRSDAEKSSTHLAIGRLWLESLSPAEQYDALFALANHLNHGRHLISDVVERNHLVELNLATARKAKASAAYRPALAYLQVALDLMGDEDWDVRYELMLTLHLEAAEAAYLSIDFVQMDRFTTTALHRATNLLDRVKAHEIRIQSYVYQGKYKEAVAMGLKVLALLGVPFPKKPTRLHVLASLFQTKLAFARRDPGKLAQQSPMTDQRALAIRNIQSKINSASYRIAPVFLPLFLFSSLRLLLKFGNDPAAIYAYASYGVFLSGMLNDIDQGAQFGELALGMQNCTDQEGNQGRALYLVHTLIQPWNMSIHKLLEPLTQDYLRCVELGDIEFATNAALTCCMYAFYGGLDLTQVERETADYHRAVEAMQGPLYRQKILWQAILNLMGRTPDPTELCGTAFGDNEAQDMKSMDDDRILMYQWHSLKLLLAYLFHDYQAAQKHADMAKYYVDTGIGVFTVTTFYFYDSLTRLAQLDRTPFIERIGVLRRVRRNQKKLKRAPANLLHKWFLVEAELARCGNRPLKAIECYEQAIHHANENNYPHEEALARELAGAFHASRGEKSMAAAHLREAMHGYRRWGALAKVNDLEQRYPQWLRGSEMNRFHDSAGEETISLTSTRTSGQLDFRTAMKASQALSREIVLEKLLKRLMQVAVENAGAQKGLLLLKKDGAWYLEAEKNEHEIEATVMQSIPLEQASQANLLLPLSLVNYIDHTMTSIVVHDAMSEKLFAGDPYVKRHEVRSLLSIPILHHGELAGILYLENNAVSGAFTENRLEILHLLASQTAISIENARLYADMEERVASRTAELKALSLRDGLTGVANRKAFDERIAEEISRVHRSGSPLSLLMIDIDYFKHVNDRFGHQAGDDCLRQVGATLLNMSRRLTDFAARYGGEEFALLLPNTDLDGALICAEKVRIAMQKVIIETGSVRHPITVSIGVAVASVDTDAHALIGNADRNLYAAKTGGRNRVMCGTPENCESDDSQDIIEQVNP